MKPRCAKGIGIPPRYVSHIEYDRDSSGKIRLAGDSLGEKHIPFQSKLDLIAKCVQLSNDHVLFSVGDHSLGPAEELATWQSDGTFPYSYLRIAWSGHEAWVVHEIVPGASMEWDIVPLSDILS